MVISLILQGRDHFAGRAQRSKCVDIKKEQSDEGERE